MAEALPNLSFLVPAADYVLRDEVPTGKEFVYDEITQKLEGLTPRQRKAAADILDAYIKNL